MTDPNAMRRYRVSENAVFRELDDEAIVLHLDTGLYFGLDAIGARIWRGLERQQSIGWVVGALVDEFDVDAERARADVDRLVEALVAKGLLVPGDVASGL